MKEHVFQWNGKYYEAIPTTEFTCKENCAGYDDWCYEQPIVVGEYCWDYAKHKLNSQALYWKIIPKSLEEISIF